MSAARQRSVGCLVKSPGRRSVGSSLSRSSVAPGIQVSGVRRDCQCEIENRSARMVVHGPEPASVSLNNGLADTKPHTGTVFLGGKEGVEYLASLVGGQSDAGVFDRYQKLFVAMILSAEGELTRAIDGLHCVDAVDHEVH